MNCGGAGGSFHASNQKRSQYFFLLPLRCVVKSSPCYNVPHHDRSHLSHLSTSAQNDGFFFCLFFFWFCFFFFAWASFVRFVRNCVYADGESEASGGLGWARRCEMAMAHAAPSLLDLLPPVPQGGVATRPPLPEREQSPLGEVGGEAGF